MRSLENYRSEVTGPFLKSAHIIRITHYIVKHIYYDTVLHIICDYVLFVSVAAVIV